MAQPMARSDSEDSTKTVVGRPQAEEVGREDKTRQEDQPPLGNGTALHTPKKSTTGVPVSKTSSAERQAVMHPKLQEAHISNVFAMHEKVEGFNKALLAHTSEAEKRLDALEKRFDSFEETLDILMESLRDLVASRKYARK